MDRWLPLSTSEQQIRLLEVAPREHADCIHCRLVVVSLLTDPTYEALSYVWGTLEAVQEIILDGSKHTVTRNLHDALTTMQYADRSRLLWVDAVCINQMDLQERTSQVAMMDKIYIQAEQVLVWLGERGKLDLYDNVLLYGKDQKRHYEEAPMDLWALNMRFETWWYRAWTYQEAVITLPFYYVRQSQTLFVVMDFEPSLSSELTKFEQVLAKRLVFYSGDRTFTDQDLEDYLKSARLHIFNVNSCCSDILSKGQAKHFVKTTFSGPFLHLEHILDSRSMRTHRTEDLLSLVLDNSIRTATDPRDLVNAFMGLATNAPQDLIRYDLPLKEWVVHTTKTLIQHSCSLDILRYVAADEKMHEKPLTYHCAQRGIDNDWRRMTGLPSWCPDWTQATRSRNFEERSQRRLILKGRFTAAKDSTADARIEDSTGLQVSGLLPDSVCLVGKVSDHFQGPENDCFLQWCWLVANSPARHRAICDGCDKIIYGIRHKCTTCPNFDLCPRCFIKTKDHQPDHTFNDLQPGARTTAPEAEDNESKLRPDLSKVPAIVIEEQGTKFRVSGSVWQDLDKVCYPFAENTTLQDAFRNTLVAGTSALEAFEKIKVIPIYEEIAFTEWWQGRVEGLPIIMFEAKRGFSYEKISEILDLVLPQHVKQIESLVHMIIQHSTLIIGEKGYIGWGPKGTHSGDMVAVLKGGDTPFVLRRLADSPNNADEIHCTLVGEAYIHGLMNGEAIEAEQAGLLKTKKFCIH